MAKNFLDIIFSRHSVRQFTGEAVKKDDLLTMLKAGMAAPSARNIQPWAFVAVTKRDLLDQLCAELPYAKMLDKAGVAIVVCGVPDMAKEFWAIDCSAATQNILLAAHALGYGAVWTAAYVYPERMAPVRKVCKIPQDIFPLCVIPIGVPVDKNEKPKDKYKPENIHWEVW